MNGQGTSEESEYLMSLYHIVHEIQQGRMLDNQRAHLHASE